MHDPIIIQISHWHNEEVLNCRIAAADCNWVRTSSVHHGGSYFFKDFNTYWGPNDRPSPRPNPEIDLLSSKMFSSFGRFVLIPTFILSTLMSPVTAKCSKPTIRKEWRKFSVAEKAHWTQAVNVRKQRATLSKLFMLMT